jgi:protoheme IX farnesyltransferase
MYRRALTATLGLLLACHPEAVVTVVVAAGLLALTAGHRPAGAALVAATVLASQLAIGWSNDAIDAARDAAVGRRGKPVATGAVSRRTVAVAAGVAAAATLWLAVLSGRPAALAAAAGLAGGLLYNWPLKASPVSVLPYAVSFAALPAFVVLALPGAPAPPGWLLAAGALLGAGAHFANVLPDLADDARTGVHGLPHRLGPDGSRWAAGGLLLGSTAALAFGPPGRPSWFGLAAVLAAAAVLPVGWYAGTRRPGSRAPFRAVLVVGLLDVLLLLLAGRSV